MANDLTAAQVVADLVQPDGPITVVSRAGELVFRRCEDATEFANIGAKARQFARQLKAGRDVPASWAEFLVHDEGTYAKCFWIHALGTNPTWSQLETLMLATHGGSALEMIYGQLVQGLAQHVVADEEANLTELGEGSEPTSGDEPSSASPETSGDGT